MDGNASSTDGRADRRAYMREYMARRRAEQRAEYGSIGHGGATGERRRAEQNALEWRPFAAITDVRAVAGITLPVVADRGRMIVRAGRHTFGGVTREGGDVLIARVPRSDTWTAREVARDRTWRVEGPESPARPCRHKRGHRATHSHGAPEIDRRTRRMIDALAATMFGHDPRIAALDRSVIAECAAATVPGYAPVESWTARAERWMRERREHVEGTWEWDTDERGNAVRVRVTDACPDCRNGERNTSWTAATPAARAFAPMPPSRATRAATARIDRDWQQVPMDGRRAVTEARIAAQRAADDWSRMIECAMFDARIEARERAARA